MATAAHQSHIAEAIQRSLRDMQRAHCDMRGLALDSQELIFRSQAALVEADRVLGRVLYSHQRSDRSTGTRN